MTARALGIRLAAAALFAGVTAWALQQQAGYVAVSWLCGSAAAGPVWLLTALAVLLLAAGGWISWQGFRSLAGDRSAEASDLLRPRRFLSLVALMAGLLFLFTILLQAGAALFLPGCVG